MQNPRRTILNCRETKNTLFFNGFGENEQQCATIVSARHGSPEHPQRHSTIQRRDWATWCKCCGEGWGAVRCTVVHPSFLLLVHRCIQVMQAKCGYAVPGVCANKTNRCGSSEHRPKEFHPLHFTEFP